MEDSIQLDAYAFRAFRNLPSAAQEAILDAVEALAENPLPPGWNKLVGGDAECRIRVGDYRVIYPVFDTHLVIVVVDVGHRREV